MMQPLWLDVSRQDYPALDRDIEVDVAIVGAGLTGIGAAYGLHGRDAAVAVLEQRTVGSGASGRNGGFMILGPARTFAQVVHTLGRDEAWKLWDLTVQNHRLTVELIDRFGIDCGYLRRGSLSLAASPDEWQLLQSHFRDLCQDGFPVCLIEQEALPRPFDRLYCGGFYQAGNAELNSGAFVRGVAGALSGDIAIYEATPVESLQRGERWQLQTPRGRVLAERVVLATNAWTPSFLAEVPITPWRGQVIATMRLPRVVVPFPMYADHGFQYWRQTADGRLVIGGWRNLDPDGERGTQEALSPLIQNAVEGFCRAVLEGECPIEYRWAGIMGFTPDMMPLAGPVPGAPGLYVAAGYSGHGVPLAFSCGMRVARAALGEREDLPAAFDPARFLGAEVAPQPSAAQTGHW